MRPLTVAESQWIFSRSDFDRTPSRDDGIGFQEELDRRKLTIEYIRSIGLRARMWVILLEIVMRGDES